MLTELSPEATTSTIAAAVSLDTVLLRGELRRRPIRRPDLEAENAAYLLLSEELRDGRLSLLQSLMDAAVSLCQAGSAGISLLEPSEGGPVQFRWTAISGQLAHAVGGSVPRDFSPCGTCLDRRAPVLFARPERHFTNLEAVGPLHEVLVLPFHVDGRQAGAIWIVAHDDTRRFDMEDVRIMSRLARFTGAAYSVLGHGVPVS